MRASVAMLVWTLTSIPASVLAGTLMSGRQGLRSAPRLVSVSDLPRRERAAA